MTPPKMANDRYNAAEAEARWQSVWEERGIFAALNKDCSKKHRTRGIPFIGALSRGKSAVPGP